MRSQDTTVYRINKNGKECFRSRSLNEIKERISLLIEKHPSVAYTIQYAVTAYDGIADTFMTQWINMEGGAQ